MRCNLCRNESFQALPFHYIWEDKRFQGCRCDHCRLVTLDPLPTDAELERLYDGEYFESGLHGLDSLGTDYETHADAGGDAARDFIRAEIRRRHPAAGSIFEIGAAMGHFLAAAREEGLRGAGIEISPEAVARAREKFGLDLTCGNVESFDPEPMAGQWDVVYAGDLFEHLRDPSGVLAKIDRLLAPGGLCIVKIPGTMNLLSTRLAMPLLQLLGRSRQLPDRPYHLYEYTTATARRMFSQRFVRVEIVNDATTPGRLNLKDGSPGYLAKFVLQFLNYPLTRLTNRFGDRMTVFARKER